MVLLTACCAQSNGKNNDEGGTKIGDYLRQISFWRWCEGSGPWSVWVRPPWNLEGEKMAARIS